MYGGIIWGQKSYVSKDILSWKKQKMLKQMASKRGDLLSQKQ